MKKLIYSILLLMISTTISCSSDDNSYTNNSSNTNDLLVGTWNVSPDLTGNTYTYNSDGTATYINTLDNETWTYEGAWKVIEDNVLIEYYPDEDEDWNEDWEEQPTLKHYFKLLNDCTMELTNYHSMENISMHYKENEENCYDDMRETKEFEISIVGNSSPEEVFPLTITYYSSDLNGDLSTKVVNTQTNTDVVQAEVLECFDKIGFKYEVIDNGETSIYYVRIKDVVLDMEIFEIDELQISNNEIFMYNIHEGTYIVE